MERVTSDELNRLKVDLHKDQANAYIRALNFATADNITDRRLLNMLIAAISKARNQT